MLIDCIRQKYKTFKRDSKQFILDVKTGSLGGDVVSSYIEADLNNNTETLIVKADKEYKVFTAKYIYSYVLSGGKIVLSCTDDINASEIKKLYELGFKVQLWLVPWVRHTAKDYNYLKLNNAFVRNVKGEVTVREWWNGNDPVLDMTNLAYYR